jgi:hypothetical protein
MVSHKPVPVRYIKELRDNAERFGSVLICSAARKSALSCSLSRIASRIAHLARCRIGWLPPAADSIGGTCNPAKKRRPSLPSIGEDQA